MSGGFVTGTAEFGPGWCLYHCGDQGRNWEWVGFNYTQLTSDHHHLILG